jgi:hypothetical protein
LSGPFWPILGGACCRSSVVEHSIGNGEVDSSILSGSTTVRAKKSGFRRSQTPRPNRGADAHFYFASETLLDISLKRFDRICFLRRQRRLPNGNLTLPAAWAEGQKLRHHLDLIKASLNIKNT